MCDGKTDAEAEQSEHIQMEGSDVRMEGAPLSAGECVGHGDVADHGGTPMATTPERRAPVRRGGSNRIPADDDEEAMDRQGAREDAVRGMQRVA